MEKQHVYLVMHNMLGDESSVVSAHSTPTGAEHAAEAHAQADGGDWRREGEQWVEYTTPEALGAGPNAKLLPDVLRVGFIFISALEVID